mgnify:FL=1
MSNLWIDKEMAKAVGNNLAYLHSATFDPQVTKTTDEIGMHVWQFIKSLKHDIEARSADAQVEANRKRIKAVHAEYQLMERMRKLSSYQFSQFKLDGVLPNGETKNVSDEHRRHNVEYGV